MIPAHQQRVLDEHIELSQKIAKLEAFVKMPKFADLDTVDQDHLDIQLKAMRLYSHVLAMRISRFELETP